MPKPIKTMVSIAVLAMSSQSLTYAGAFSLYTESSAAAIGNFAAGVAAEGADASIGWYNPAGLVLIKKQEVLLGGVGVFPSTQLTGTSTYTTPSPFGPLHYAQSFNGLQAAESAVVPSLHYALPLGERAVFGLSLVSPFGLATHYSETSPVRYAATLSKFETINLSPELGALITDHFSIGAGLDLQYARVKFNQMVGAPAYLQFFAIANPGSGVTPNAFDSSSNNSGDSFGVGFHAGAMFMFDERHTRIGVNYQSGMNHQFVGTSQLTGRLADPTLNIGAPLDASASARYTSQGLYSDPIDLPQIVTLSGYRDINDQFALLGSVVYSAWSSFKTINLNNVAVGVPNPLSGDVIQTVVNASTPEYYRNAWRVALGANYHVNEQWMMRVGGGYDQTPTVNAYRDVRLPDCDRWALSIGAHYQMMPSVGFDAGYTYLFAANDAQLNNTESLGSSTYNVNATSKNHAQLLGLQVVWTIDPVGQPTK